MCTDLFFLSSFHVASFSGSLQGMVGFKEPLAPVCVIHSIPMATVLHLWASSRRCKLSAVVSKVAVR